MPPTPIKTLSALTGPAKPPRAAILRALEAGEDLSLVQALATARLRS